MILILGWPVIRGSAGEVRPGRRMTRALLGMFALRANRVLGSEWNVRVGRHDRPDPDGLALSGAAVQSGADQVVDRMPNGWETLLSKQFRGGLELSGGQWQRLAVARGLYRDAPLLIWDEPTAPLDAKAEFAVYESLRTLATKPHSRADHPPPGQRAARGPDLPAARGELAEEGTHADQLAMGGRYAELYELQSHMYADA
ncbi:MAG TPA: ATP-binding cassette domain-containing protein [Actinokineospora sp.]|nr:ATP-binding cassette domain-containing protein [Actinokineospora sp.]